MSDAQWYRALRPGTLKGGKFVKADELFQLGEGDVFSDKWMEKHEAPAAVAPSKTDAKKEQEQAVREHEEADRIRRGKYSVRSVPRSPEGKKEHDERVKEEAKRNPPTVDLGSRDPAAPGGIHETSNNPSRIDENARRSDK